MTGQPTGFTGGTVASTALPRSKTAPAGSHVFSMAPVTCLRPVRAGLLN